MTHHTPSEHWRGALYTCKGDIPLWAETREERVPPAAEAVGFPRESFMKLWMLFATLTFLSWGLWGFLPKFAFKYLDPQSTLIYQALGTLLVVPPVLAIRQFDLSFHPRGATFAVVSGVFGALGALCFLLALSQGKAAVVVSYTALYPLVTIVLSFLLLEETVTLTQGIGILFALLAVVFLAM